MRVERPTLLKLDVTVSYPAFELRVKRKLSLDGVTGIFGASGSGKTTLLRVIAGLERAATGQVEFGGDAWLDDEQRLFRPAYERPVGYVFQDARLFRHLDVAGNLRFATTRAPDSSIGYDEIVSTFDLQDLLNREVGSLSGGERQRVAIARTLLAHPRLLLLDEPLAALDIARKSDILPYLEALPRRFNIPMIYVSHAVDEVARLADQVMVLKGGDVDGVERPVDLLERLDLSSLPEFEAATILEVKVIEQDPELHLTRLEYRGQTIVVPELGDREEGAAVRLYIRAGDVAVATQKPSGISFRNVLAGRIASIEPDASGPLATVSIDIGGTKLRASLTRHAVDELGLNRDLPVYALVKTASFDRAGRL